MDQHAELGHDPGIFPGFRPSERYFLALTLVLLAPARLRPARQLVNARQYSIVKDLDCLNNQFLRNKPRSSFVSNRVLNFPAAFWWAWVELNHRPHPYQGCALAI